MAVTRRKRADAEIPNYEKSREQRIKENNERMKKLGIFDLALKLKSPTPKASPHKRRPQKLPLSASPRRSSRLKGVNTVNYSEKTKRFSEDLENVEEEGYKPVERYVKDGKRINDPDIRETCHQCRQKTFRIHAHCSSCNAIRGQFCGSCLNARYGEDVNEAIQNANWVCPVCRGICNCSFCRKRKGFAPTGFMYGKVKKLGFRSVAHYFELNSKTL